MMKCLKCDGGELKLVSYDSGNRPYAKTNSKGMLVCNRCGHKEVFR